MGNQGNEMGMNDTMNCQMWQMVCIVAQLEIVFSISPGKLENDLTMLSHTWMPLR